MACPWCEERTELDRQIQESLDRARFDGYLQRIGWGDMAAVAPAVGLARRIGMTRQLARVLAQQKAAA
jgi:hypothetical protein